MRIDIKNRFTGEIIFSHKQANNSVKIAVKKAIELKVNLSSADLSSADLRSADLSFADLRSADLSYADLSYANLSYANLSYADLIGSYYEEASISSIPLQISGLKWRIMIFDYHIKIGCQLFLTVEWEAFDDETIDSFHPKALVFWNKYKDFIIPAAKAHQKYNEEI